MNEEQTQPILAAEDEESDRMILEIAFQRAHLRHRLVLVKDGQEAVDYLSGNGGYADRLTHPLPGLIVLDLKMPRMSGFEVLTWVAGQPAFKNLPAVVLSSSADESDMVKARKLGARDYFIKPHRIDQLVNIAQQMQARWLSGPAYGAASVPSLSLEKGPVVAEAKA